MRIVAEIPHPDLKITVFSWNEKYLIKLEKGPFEQTYKISEMDVMGEEEVRQLLDTEFLDLAMEQFRQMGRAWMATRERANGF